jgi:hypothetical protein
MQAPIFNSNIKGTGQADWRKIRLTFIEHKIIFKIKLVCPKNPTREEQA